MRDEIAEATTCTEGFKASTEKDPATALVYCRAVGYQYNASLVITDICNTETASNCKLAKSLKGRNFSSTNSD